MLNKLPVIPAKAGIQENGFPIRALGNDALGIVASIILFSFLLRLIFLFVLPPAPVSPNQDDGLYRQTALQILAYAKKSGALLHEAWQGELFGGRGALARHGLEIPWGALKKGPVYPLFLALVFGLFGNHPFVVFVLQAALIALAGGLVYWLGSRLYGNRAGWIAAAITGLYPPLGYVTSVLYQESLTAFLLAAFYVLLWRWKENSSLLLSLGTGCTLFLLGFSKSLMVYFPFVLLGALFFWRAWRQVIRRQISHFSVLLAAFFIPCLFWTGIVSWQFHKPGALATGNAMGRGLLCTNVATYQGWAPDFYAWKRLAPQAEQMLKQAGVGVPIQGGEKVWPPEEEMAKAAFRYIAHHPIAWGTLCLVKFKRLWWEPFDWPWRSLLPLPDGVRAGHKFLMLLAVIGLAIALGTSRISWMAGSLILAPLYVTAIVLLYCVETRYNVPFLPILFVFSGIALDFFLSRKGRRIKVYLAAGLILLAFIAWNWTSRIWNPWQARIQPGSHAVRQEIFLPEGSLQGSIAQNVRVDMVLPERSVPWVILVNGNEIAKLENIRHGPPPEIFSDPEVSYKDILAYEGKKIFQMRQWFSFPIPSGILQEGSPARIEIRCAQGHQTSSHKADMLIFGDNPVSAIADGQPVFQGPLFGHSAAEVSIYKYLFDRDPRLTGRTVLHHQGPRSAFFDGVTWQSQDLSPAWGRQKGEYRIRLESQLSDGTTRIY